MSSDQSGWQGSGGADETAPFTHRPYGSDDAGPDEPTQVGPPSPSGDQAPPPSPYGSPSAPSTPSTPSYGSSGGSPYGSPFPTESAAGASAANPYGAPAPAPGGQYGAPSPYGAPAPAAPYGYGGYGGSYYQQSHGRATTSMVLGIVSLGVIVVGFCLYGLPSLIALVTGPIGLWLGLSAKREIDASPGTYANRGQAVAGWIMGLISTILAVLIVVALIALVAWLGWALSSSSTY